MNYCGFLCFQILFLSFILFFLTRNRTPDFVLARQVLCCWSVTQPAFICLLFYCPTPKQHISAIYACPCGFFIHSLSWVETSHINIRFKMTRSSWVVLLHVKHVYLLVHGIKVSLRTFWIKLSLRTFQRPLLYSSPLLNFVYFFKAELTIRQDVTISKYLFRTTNLIPLLIGDAVFKGTKSKRWWSF